VTGGGTWRFTTGLCAAEAGSIATEAGAIATEPGNTATAPGTTVDNEAYDGIAGNELAVHTNIDCQRATQRYYLMDSVGIFQV